MLVECLRDTTLCSTWILLACVFWVTLQIPGQWTCPWKTKMAVILHLLQIVPFWNFRKEIVALFCSTLQPAQEEMALPCQTRCRIPVPLPQCSGQHFLLFLVLSDVTGSFSFPVQIKSVSSLSIHFPFSPGHCALCVPVQHQPQHCLNKQITFFLTTRLGSRSDLGFALNFHVSLRVQG